MTDQSEPHAFRPGDWVRVRRAEEIFATLDDHGELDGLPFMPEMLPFAGKRFRVLRRAEAACATDQITSIRRLTGLVHLAGLLCDGSAHGSCQSGCLFFWNNAWLEPTSPPADIKQPHDQQAPSSPGLLPILEQWTTQNTSSSEQASYRCQATQLWQASSPLPAWQLRQYLRATSANGFSLRKVISSVVVSCWRKLKQRLARTEHRLPVGKRTPQKVLNLQVGDLVEVCSIDEIIKTLDVNNKNRGLWFDPQMAQYAGRHFRVAARVERIIHEGTGRMIELQSPAVSLESVGCDGCWHRFCSREAPLFWREIWLKRVETAVENNAVERAPFTQVAADSPDNAPAPVAVRG